MISRSAVCKPHRGLDPPDFDSPHNRRERSQSVRALHASVRSEQLHERNVRSQLRDVSDSQRRAVRRAGEHRRQRESRRYVSCGAVPPCRSATPVRSTLARLSSRRVSGTSAIPKTTSSMGKQLNVTPPPYGNGGTSTDCANAIGNPDSYLPTTCAYSLADDRTALDYIMQADFTRSYGRHTFAAGTTYDAHPRAQSTTPSRCNPTISSHRFSRPERRTHRRPLSITRPMWPTHIHRTRRTAGV